MSKLISRVEVNIISGQSVSSEAALNGLLPKVLQMGTGWDAADICFAGSCGDGSWYYIYNETGTIVSCTTGVNHRINLPDTYLKDNISIKVCSGPPTGPVNQTADRKLFIELWED